MAAFDEFLAKLGISPDDAKQLENTAAPKYKWKTGHPIEILNALERSLPAEWVEWEPETLMKAVGGLFGNRESDEQKIFALQVCMSTNRPWFDWDVFENACLAFTGHTPLWGVLEPLDLHELAFGLGVLSAVREDELFSDDVLGYITATMLYNGLRVQPPCGPFIENVMFFAGAIPPEGIMQIWNTGVRSDLDNDPTDFIEAQLQKMQIFEDWYHFGKDFDL